MPKFDIIVVGAGTGGCIAAKTGAKMGYKVCLIDHKPNQEIGDKICGDAIGKHHFDRLGIAPPRDKEQASLIKGIDIFSPDVKTVFRTKGEGLHGFMVNRLELGQRLLGEAISSGVELRDNTSVLMPIMEGNYVKGVTAKSTIRDEKIELIGKIVIDASGMVAVIRKQVPLDWGLEREILGEDIQICYQEIREVSTIEELDFLQIYLNHEVSPGGYVWIFPKGENIVNAGIGIQMKKGFLNPKEQFYKYVLTNPLLKNSRKIRGGGGIVSTRRPMNCMVGNGVLFIGDAANQPNPIHGGGIGPSMLSGQLAAKTACVALEEEDFSKTGLWPYNSEYMAEYGAKTASLDVFRLFLQKCSDMDLNYGMSNRLIMEEDILKASMGEDLKLNITDKAQRVFRGIRRLSFLRALGVTAEKMKEIKELYRNFPKPEDHAQWSLKVELIIKEMMNLTIS